MHKSRATAWLLERAAGEARGAAIYGDLLEMSATRGAGWFWLAYLRTLLALMSRTAAAFVVGTVVFVAMYWLPLILPRWWMRSWASSLWAHHVFFFVGTANIAYLLWFLLPFAAARYGTQDRFVLFTFAVCAMMTVAYFAPVFPLLLAAIGIALVTVIAAIFSEEWRGAGITLAGTTAVSVLVELILGLLAHFGVWYHNKHHLGPHFRFFALGFAAERHLFWTVMWALFALNAVTLVLVSAKLRRRFMRGERIALS